MSEQELGTWLRRRIEERRYLARHAIELGNAEVWAERSSGVLVTGEPTADDVWYGTWALGDSSLTRLMEANDPRDTIARCEVELAILGIHPLIREAGPSGGVIARCVCQRWPDAWPCRTVRLLGSGYRYRPGYLEEWKP